MLTVLATLTSIPEELKRSEYPENVIFQNVIGKGNFPKRIEI